MKIITGGVTAAKGFQAASTAAGIKYQGRTDMAMVYSEKPCVAAGTFTTNIVKAAPVKWDQDIVYNHPSAQVIICNSGIANACTGEEGFGYCRATAKAAAETLNVDENSVLVASTGVIGMQLPIEKLSAGVKAMAPKLQGTLEAGNDAAKAIMTTDTKEKEVAVEIEVGGKTVTIGGMCKGSGMIHPNMCTMLGFVTTDACISKKLLQEALSEDVKDTYNMVSVDGDTSTNDTVLLLANGMAENPEINEKNEDYQKFCSLFESGVDCYIINTGFYMGKGISKEVSLNIIEKIVDEEAEFKPFGPLEGFEYMECEGYPIPNFDSRYKQLLRERMQVRLNFLLAFNQKYPKTALPVDAISRLETVLQNLES